MFRTVIVNLVQRRFAGHSKWNNIRHIKGARDAERANMFTRLARQMKAVAAEAGTNDPSRSVKLSQLVEQCKRINMPTATMQSILKACVADKSNLKLHIVDIIGPGGCGILCELYTSNLHHTKQQISTALKKAKSKYGEGAGSYLFEEKGIIEAEHPQFVTKTREEKLELATEHAIESNAEEVNLSDDNEVYQFLCGPECFTKTQNNLEALGYKILSGSIEFIPVKMQELSETDMEFYDKLMTKLDQMPEVVRLFNNVSVDVGK